jgi:hypothetical protein
MIPSSLRPSKTALSTRLTPRRSRRVRAAAVHKRIACVAALHRAQQLVDSRHRILFRRRECIRYTPASAVRCIIFAPDGRAEDTRVVLFQEK